MKRATLVLLLALLSGEGVLAQYGAVGLSAVRARRYGNVGLGSYPSHSGDRFAAALAIGDFNGDGADDLASGAPGHHNFDGDFAGSGVVFVHYSLPGVGLAGGSAGQVLTQAGNPDPAELNDGFGGALAACDFNGDGRDDLAVGIPFEDLPGAHDAGAVQIHVGSTAGLTAFSTQILTQESGDTPDSSEPSDYFGFAVACGRFDADNFADLAVGIWDENLLDGVGNTIFGGGTVVVYRGGAAGLQTTGVTLIRQGAGGVNDLAESSDYFGWALATGDFDGDSFDDLAIGVPGEDNIGDGIEHSRGAVHVLFGSAAGLQTADDYFRTESGIGGTSELGDRFGEALAGGDFDHDGFDDLAVGIPYEDLSPAVDSGQVAVLYGSASGFVFARTQFWSENTIYDPGESEDGDRLGAALAAGDFDGDGRDDLAMGGPGEFGLVAGDGAVTILMGASTGLSSSRRYSVIAGYDGVPGPDNQAQRGFGGALASGDLDGDGHADLLIGAADEDDGALVDSGAEWVFYGSLFSDGFGVSNTARWSLHVP